jgi:hypothetical protein
MTMAQPRQPQAILGPLDVTEFYEFIQAFDKLLFAGDAIMERRKRHKGSFRGCRSIREVSKIIDDFS